MHIVLIYAYVYEYTRIKKVLQGDEKKQGKTVRAKNQDNILSSTFHIKNKLENFAKTGIIRGHSNRLDE